MFIKIKLINNNKLIIMSFCFNRSELKIKAKADDDGRLFTCEANNGLGPPVSTNISILVSCKYINHISIVNIIVFNEFYNNLYETLYILIGCFNSIYYSIQGIL